MNSIWSDFINKPDLLFIAMLVLAAGAIVIMEILSQLPTIFKKPEPPSGR